MLSMVCDPAQIMPAGSSVTRDARTVPYLQEQGYEVEHTPTKPHPATGETLFAEPCGLDAASVGTVLSRLFAEHGAPIAIKCDNGSGFIAEQTRLLLSMHGVLVLFSPPGTPSYNGSCEAGVGSIKHRAQDFAAARGERVVNRNDLFMAQEQANACLTAVAAACRPTLEALRAEVWSRYQEWESRQRKGQGLAPEAGLDHAEQACLDRFAIAQALKETTLAGNSVHAPADAPARWGFMS